MSMTLRLGTENDFSFQHTIAGHGWYDLPPFVRDAEAASLRFVFRDKGRAVSAKICGEDGAVNIELDSDSVRTERVFAVVRHVLRLDDDMSEFYATTATDPQLCWIKASGAGRLLRSSTVFEDLAKTLCTTNCSWSLTRKMVENLVETLGEPTPGGAKAFPTAEAMASVSAEFYRNVIRAGYRSPYFVEMAKRVAAAEIDPESWLNSQLPTAELKREIKRIKGFGDYAAEHLLKLLGRYDNLALDSWLRKQFYNKRNRGNACPDAAIEKFYERFGKWRGLAFWCDMTESWFANQSA